MRHIAKIVNHRVSLLLLSFCVVFLSSCATTGAGSDHGTGAAFGAGAGGIIGGIAGGNTRSAAIGAGAGALAGLIVGEIAANKREGMIDDRVSAERALDAAKADLDATRRYNQETETRLRDMELRIQRLEGKKGNQQERIEARAAAVRDLDAEISEAGKSKVAIRASITRMSAEREELAAVEADRVAELDLKIREMSAESAALDSTTESLASLRDRASHL